MSFYNALRQNDGKAMQAVFEAGDSFFIPQGLRCSWRQPTALKKCYIVYTPAKPELSAKL